MGLFAFPSSLLTNSQDASISVSTGNILCSSLPFEAKANWCVARIRDSAYVISIFCCQNKPLLKSARLTRSFTSLSVTAHAVEPRGGTGNNEAMLSTSACFILCF